MPKRRQKKKTQTYTYADYLTWGEDARCELIDGIVYSMTPAPSRTHADIAKALFRQLDSFFLGKPCQVYFAPFDVRLPREDAADSEADTVVQPDIIVVCDETKLDEKGCRGAPDLAIEITSPSTASKDHITKKRLYEKVGVKEYWLVSPGNRIMTAYRRNDNNKFDPAHIYGDTDVVPSSLFPGLRSRHESPVSSPAPRGSRTGRAVSVSTMQNLIPRRATTAVSLTLLLIMVLIWCGIAPVTAEDAPPMEVARKAVVEGVPTEQPYNGCLLVRIDASTTSKVLGFVKNGDVVVIEEMNGLWARISSPEKGYCWASYLKVTETQALPANQPQSLPTLLEISDPATRLDHLEKGRKSQPTANFSAIATLTTPPTDPASIPGY